MTYEQVHDDLARYIGSAREFPCVGCQKPALDWSYNYTANPVLICPVLGRPYGTVKDYSPRCRRCHKAFDRAHDPRQEQVMTTNGRRVGRLTAERVAADPAYRAKIIGHVEPHHHLMQTDESTKDLYRRAMTRTNLRLRRCSDCGHVANVGNMAQHLTRAGHARWEEVVPNVQ